MSDVKCRLAVNEEILGRLFVVIAAVSPVMVYYGGFVREVIVEIVHG